MLDAELAVANKTRPRHEVAAVTQVIGDVRDKVALIGDDMIVTGGTILAAAEALRAAGAREVRAFATHPLFTDGALQALPKASSRRSPSPTPSRSTRPSAAEAHRAHGRGPPRRRRSGTSSRTHPSRRSSPARTSSSEPGVTRDADAGGSQRLRRMPGGVRLTRMADRPAPSDLHVGVRPLSRAASADSPSRRSTKPRPTSSSVAGDLTDDGYPDQYLGDGFGGVRQDLLSSSSALLITLFLWPPATGRERNQVLERRGSALAASPVRCRSRPLPATVSRLLHVLADRRHAARSTREPCPHCERAASRNRRINTSCADSRSGAISIDVGAFRAPVDSLDPLRFDFPCDWLGGALRPPEADPISCARSAGLFRMADGSRGTPPGLSTTWPSCILALPPACRLLLATSRQSQVVDATDGHSSRWDRPSRTTGTAPT